MTMLYVWKDVEVVMMEKGLEQKRDRHPTSRSRESYDWVRMECCGSKMSLESRISFLPVYTCTGYEYQTGGWVRDTVSFYQEAAHCWLGDLQVVEREREDKMEPDVVKAIRNGVISLLKTIVLAY